MEFLKQSNDYSSESALKNCLAAKMYKECAFLHIKNGNTEEAVQLLIDHCCDNTKEVVDLAIQFNINSDSLWDKIIARSKGDAKKIKALFQYSDIYKDPKKFIDALDDDIEIEQIYEPLLDTINRLKLQKTVLKTALAASERAKHKLSNQLIDMHTVGFYNIQNKCNLCEKDLLLS